MMSDSMHELKQMRIWFLWRWGTDKNGNTTKVPFAATGGETGTDNAHSSTWVTHDNAVAAAEKYHAAGVGFKIPENYFFLDIDHRELSDTLVQTLLSRFDSYTERSVSGGGIHIYGKCDFTKLPTYIDKKDKVRLDSQFYQKNSKIDLELYVGGITNRFAAYTGNIIEDKPLRECTSAVLTTLDKNMRRKEKIKYSANRDGDRADFDIACSLRKQKTEISSKSCMTRAISAIMVHSPRRTQRSAPLLLSAPAPIRTQLMRYSVVRPFTAISGSVTITAKLP